MKPRFKFDGSVLVMTKDAVFPRTKKAAMRMSIEKWETIVQGYKQGLQPIHATGSDSCALCQLYLARGCRDCPVTKYSDGLIVCNGTPYDEYCGRKSLRNAQAELAFLRMVQKKEGLL